MIKKVSLFLVIFLVSITAYAQADTLNSHIGTSSQQQTPMQLLQHIINHANVNDVTCTNGSTCIGAQVSCCLKLDHQNFYCAALANAVCCPDGVHYCPGGYQCLGPDPRCVKDAE